MTKRNRLESLGRALLEGGETVISARVVGRGTLDPDKHLQFEKRSFVDQDFSGLKLDSFCSIRRSSHVVPSEKIHIDDASFGEGLRQSLYRDCIFDGARFRAVAPGIARFENCSFRDVTIYELFANRVELVNCVFSGRLKKGVLSGKRPPEFRRWWERSRNRIEKNDFSGVEFGDFGFTGGVDLTRQILPRSPNFKVLWNGAESVLRARERVGEWAEDETKRLALVILDSLDLVGIGRSEHLLFRAYPRGQLAEASAQFDREFAKNCLTSESSALPSSPDSQTARPFARGSCAALCVKLLEVSA